jgi:hypothetical protein
VGIAGILHRIYAFPVLFERPGTRLVRALLGDLLRVVDADDGVAVPGLALRRRVFDGIGGKKPVTSSV